MGWFSRSKNVRVTANGKRLTFPDEAAADHWKRRVTEAGLTVRGVEYNGQASYLTLAGPDGERARAFLLNESVDRELYYIVVETPDGAWGLDIEGLYLEGLRPWQLETGSAEYRVPAGSLAGNTRLASLAKQGKVDNFLVWVDCGRCTHHWIDGVRYQNRTLTRCPSCGAKNLVDSSNVEVILYDREPPRPSSPLSTSLDQSRGRAQVNRAPTQSRGRKPAHARNGGTGQQLEHQQIRLCPRSHPGWSATRKEAVVSGKMRSAVRAERILILYQQRVVLDPGEIQQLVEAYAGGIADLNGVRVTAYGVGEPTSDLALALVSRLEGEGKLKPEALERTTTKPFETSKGPVVVAGVWPADALPPGTEPSSTTAEPPAPEVEEPAAEMALILHPADAKPGADEIQQLMGAVARDAGLDLARTRLLPLSFNFAPEKGHALAIVDALVDQGRVSPGSVERTVTYNFTVNGAWRLVALIHANAMA